MELFLFWRLTFSEGVNGEQHVRYLFYFLIHIIIRLHLTSLVIPFPLFTTSAQLSPMDSVIPCHQTASSSWTCWTIWWRLKTVWLQQKALRLKCQLFLHVEVADLGRVNLWCSWSILLYPNPKPPTNKTRRGNLICEWLFVCLPCSESETFNLLPIYI